FACSRRHVSRDTRSTTRSRRHVAVRSAVFMHSACPACSVQQGGHAGGVRGVVLTGTPLVTLTEAGCSSGLRRPAGHALISLLVLNGLRVSEATGADIEQLGLERGHRTLTITRRAATSSPSRWHGARRGRWTWPRASAPAGRCSWPQTGGGWTGTAPGGSSAASHARPDRQGRHAL